jgi:hypothetical protein
LVLISVYPILGIHSKGLKRDWKQINFSCRLLENQNFAPIVNKFSEALVVKETLSAKKHCRRYEDSIY